MEITPTVPPPITPPPPLPPTGGPARAVLLLANPRLLHLYWVRDDALNAALARARGPARIVREVSADGTEFHPVQREEFDFAASGWYLTNDRTDTHFRVRLGLVEDGEFRTLLTSNAVRVPRVTAGDTVEVWRDLESLRPGTPTPSAPLPREESATSPGGRVPWMLPRATPGAARRKGVPAPEAKGYLAFVLHAHLPFVRHPEREFFLEESWLFEGMTETYLPLLDVFEHLLKDEVPARVTLSLTPTLTAMLRDPVLMDKYARHLDQMAELAGREVERTRKDPDLSPVTGFYRDRIEHYRWRFNEAYRRDLVAQFARLESAGVLEIIGCAATHGLLPALSISPRSVRAQIGIGVAEHRRQIGRPPRGFWLPECAYFEGLDRFLADEGIEYFFVDAHALRHGARRPRLDVQGPIFCPAGVAAFARDQETTTQVWSSQEGYPGDVDYRDFYRDIGFDLPLDLVGAYLDPAGIRHMTGFKYYRITGRTDDKAPYRRDWALRKAVDHARDFVNNRRMQVNHLSREPGRPPLITAMYDAELFGHWWFEGPVWMETVLRSLADQGLRAVSPGDYLDRYPTGQVSEPATSSWGDAGYFDVWINGETDWIYPPLHDAGRRMEALAAREAPAGEVERRALAQAGRELLLAQASDWPFILRNRTATGYARQRVLEHLDRFARLADQIERGAVDFGWLAALETLDNPFPEIDYRAWRPA